MTRRSERAVGWGILGTGMILGKVAHALRHTENARLIAIASRDETRARQAAEQHAARRGHGSYERLLADPEVDVVWNALHNGLHREWTIRALAAGKHVLCEKPLACTAAEAAAMFAAARANGRFLMEGFMYRFHPQLKLVRSIIDDGQIGEVVNVRANYLSCARDRGNPRFRPDAGGGALLDLGCYCVNLARWIAAAEPIRVTAQSRLDSQWGIDLTTTATLEFPNGVTAQLACSFETEGVYNAEIIGQAGRILIPHPWRPPAWPAQIEVVRQFKSTIHRLNTPDIRQDLLLPFILEAEHFNRAVLENQLPTYPGNLSCEADGLNNARAIDAVKSSAREHLTLQMGQPGT